MTLYTMPITLPNAKEPQEFRFYVSGQNVKIQWSVVYSESTVRNTQNIEIDSWFQHDWLVAHGLTDYKGDTFSIDTAREMWNYLYDRHSVEAKRNAEAYA